VAAIWIITGSDIMLTKDLMSAKKQKQKQKGSIMYDDLDDLYSIASIVSWLSHRSSTICMLNNCSMIRNRIAILVFLSIVALLEGISGKGYF
jgi:hypothetical protein